MPQFPTTIAPSSVSIGASQPSGKSTAVTGRTQSRSSGIHKWTLDFSYDLLELTERNEILAFLTSQRGRHQNFSVAVPTLTTNSNLTTALVSVDGTYAAGTSEVGITGLSGGESLDYFNMVQVTGRSKVYTVVDFSTPTAGAQTLTLSPPLDAEVTVSDTLITKNCRFTVSLDDDEFSGKTQQVHGSVGFSMTEELT